MKGSIHVNGEWGLAFDRDVDLQVAGIDAVGCAFIALGVPCNTDCFKLKSKEEKQQVKRMSQRLSTLFAPRVPVPTRNNGQRKHRVNRGLIKGGALSDLLLGPRLPIPISYRHALPLRSPFLNRGAAIRGSRTMAGRLHDGIVRIG